MAPPAAERAHLETGESGEVEDKLAAGRARVSWAPRYSWVGKVGAPPRFFQPRSSASVIL